MLPVVSYRNSTSNHNHVFLLFFRSIVVSYRNSTSNHNCLQWSRTGCIVVSYRNSTSNHNLTMNREYAMYVVSYRNSTSNHNHIDTVRVDYIVVSYRNSTSNHNRNHILRNSSRLYLIEILHQTTTPAFAPMALYSCILSKFYIKPQLASQSNWPILVVSYRNSTSNHNPRAPIG